MGDRVSISFVNGRNESVALFSHWGGMGFVKEARQYLKELKKEMIKQGSMMPLYRGEPDTVMVDFIRWYTKDEKRIESNLYLGKDETDGDNGDNGHYALRLDTTELQDTLEEAAEEEDGND